MVKTNSFKAWVLAARPKTLTGAIAPVLVGAAYAYVCIMHGDSQSSMLGSSLLTVHIQFFLCLLFAVLMQIDANLINDYFDFRKGTDREDRLGPERACAQGWITPRAMLWGIGVTTFLSCCVGLAIMFTHQQWELLLVGVLCVLFCFLYTTHLSYLGWGDLLVLIFFGFIPVVFTYYVLMGGWHFPGLWPMQGQIPLLLAGLAMGMVTDNLLMVNNYRDRAQDFVSGKRTLVVRIIEAQRRRYGDEQGRKEGEQLCLDLYLWFGVLSVLSALVALFLFPYSSIRWPLLLVYLIFHFKTFRQLKTLDGKALNMVLGATARNIFLFGLLLAISVFL